MNITSKKINIIITIVSLSIIIIFTILIFQNSKILQSRDKGVIGKVTIFVKGIQSPQGLTLGSDEKLFTQCSYDGKISVIDKDGKAFDYIYLDNCFGYGIDIDKYDNILIAANNEVVKIDNYGNVLQSYKGFKQAYDIELTPDNTIFISDSKENIIYKVSPQGKITEFAVLGNRKSTTAANVTGICLDKEFKNLYAVNMFTGNLYKISLTNDYEAKELQIIASNLKSPNFIDVDKAGNVYITCLGDDTVVRVDQNSIAEVIVTQDKLSAPSGIVVSGSENSDSILYIASKDSDSIYKINLGIKNKTSE